ncbi:uncharacterized protein MELLADRAFT_68359 [Melampsora larici-populina 98AG31]|uniref:Uncharacterized protein n=1 Tax=Melampsora larici-populina (strain 98AG31 / pathotype 3-4-7) TaxID=747676 RepID=F4S6I6_MELLP|nr:uncharacterized protein MELLADRAFT_68359 [Melampsora larici-populina 98AG31]EGF99694.1 hypothetical protein MELLADRAFT_68359 [Melampsora larici-populina 98AG31]
MAPHNPNNPVPPATGLKKPRYNSSQTFKMLSAWDKIEENWCNKKCDSLSCALIQNKAPRPSTIGPNTLSGNLLNDGIKIDYQSQHQFEHNDNDDPLSDMTESDAKSDDSQQSIASIPKPGLTVTAANGDVNQRCCIREERQWQEVIGPMFKVFMVCKRVAFNWSWSDWDLDRKAQCQCSVAKKRIRHIAMGDIMSE